MLLSLVNQVVEGFTVINISIRATNIAWHLFMTSPVFLVFSRLYYVIFVIVNLLIIYLTSSSCYRMYMLGM